MRSPSHLCFVVIFLATFSSCNSQTECEEIQSWEIEDYSIVKSKCPDSVLSHYYSYTVRVGNKKIKGSAVSPVDSCTFTWQARNDRLLTFNICNHTIQTIEPTKIPLDARLIDSITIFSKAAHKTQLLTGNQVGKIVTDWNNSRPRGYSEKPFDSAFSVFPAYQYKLTVFSKGYRRYFYGYNYLILDSSNWKYEMSTPGDLDYFHNYWKK